MASEATTSSSNKPATTTTSSSNSKQQQKDKVVPLLFPVGPAGKRELRNELKATTNPARTIAEFQESHSLHTMTAKALGTLPATHYKNTRKTAGTVETLDSDSVLTFLSHLGVRQYEVHKRVSDQLLQQLCDEIRKTKTTDHEVLLDLLKSCWAYATTISELRPVLWAVLKQLGPQTPLAVLTALTEREVDNNNGTTTTTTTTLRHAEIFRPLPLSLKRLCWEADWENRLPPSVDAHTTTFYHDPAQFLAQIHTTVLYDTIRPHVDAYLKNTLLCEAADRTYCLTISERRIITTQRRALTKSTMTTGTSTTTSGAPQSTVAPSGTTLTTGKAVSHLRSLLCDTTYRPKLLYAVLSMLMAQHGVTEKEFLGGSQHLSCTLVADLLLSAGGPLPKSYDDVLALTRTLDDVVQEANLSDINLAKIQASLKLIFQPDVPDSDQVASSKTTPTKTKADVDAPSTSVRRQLNRLITAGLTSMKESDPQQLFLNPVTDVIAPGYSKIIKQPMCIVTMEEKLDSNSYNSISEWETDVKLMFKNCIDYNRGNAGQWFRSEANRQAKIFKEEIYPKAQRLYMNEIAKRNVALMQDSSSSPMNNGADGIPGSKRSKSGPEIQPLEPSSKKRKKEKEEFQPSMPALAAMLLSDPFVVRLLLARVLRELRRGVVTGQNLPVAHSVVPSILQILHVARWSKQICATRGKKYFIPAAGFKASDDDPIATVSYDSLRRYIPVLLRLLLEADFDRRIALGGDLHPATQSTATLQSPPPLNTWGDDNNSSEDPIVSALMSDALIQICQPGTKSETSLAVTFPKFATVLTHASSSSLLHDRAFFVCLVQAVLRHKTKLPRPTRDAIVATWVSSWLREESSMTSAAHEYLIQLFNDWSAMGNVLLPRESLLRFIDDVIDTVNSASETHNFAHMWTTGSDEFSAVRAQYERMISFLPESLAIPWRQKHGILGTEIDAVDEEPVAAQET